MNAYVFEIDDGESTWIVEENEDKALRHYLKDLVPEVTEDLSKIDESYLNCLLKEIEVTKLDDDHVLKIHDEFDVLVTKTAKEWAELGCGSMIGTTCY